MSPAARSPDPDEKEAEILHATGEPGLSRRRFLEAASAAGAVATATAVLGASTALAETRVPLSQERAMMLQVARAGVVFPVKLPVHGASLPPTIRRALTMPRAARRTLPPAALGFSGYRPATMTRLLGAERMMPAVQVAQARAGADALIAARLQGAGQAALLREIGRQASLTASGRPSALVSTVGLALLTVLPAATADSATRGARQWLRLVQGMYRQGTLGDAIQQRGIR